MFKNKKLLLLIPAAVIALVSYTYIVQNDKEEAIGQIIMQSLKSSQYAPKEVNNDVSEKVFKLYIQRLDYNKKFLIQADINELKKFEHAIDEDINLGHFTFFDKSLEIINKRVDEAQKYYKEILGSPFDLTKEETLKLNPDKLNPLKTKDGGQKESFDFTKEETIELDAEKLTFCKSKEDLKESWRKYLKYQTLSRIVEMMDSQEKAKEKSDTVKIKSKDELEVIARQKVLKSNDDWFKRIKKLDRTDRIDIYFNSICGIY